MNVARVAALVLFLAAALLAFGWFVTESVSRAAGCIAIGLALEVLSGVPVIGSPR